MFLDNDNNKKTTIFEDLCDKCIDGRKRKTVAVLRFYSSTSTREKQHRNPVAFKAVVLSV